MGLLDGVWGCLGLREVRAVVEWLQESDTLRKQPAGSGCQVLFNTNKSCVSASCSLRCGESVLSKEPLLFIYTRGNSLIMWTTMNFGGKKKVINASCSENCGWNQILGIDRMAWHSFLSSSFEKAFDHGELSVEICFSKFWRLLAGFADVLFNSKSYVEMFSLKKKSEPKAKLHFPSVFHYFVV